MLAGSTRTGSNGTIFNFAVARYLPSGGPDATFSGDGEAVLDFGGRVDTADAVEVQGGKVVALGSSSPTETSSERDFALARFNGNGGLDKTFSGDGRQMTDFGANEFLSGATTQPDGKVVAIGTRYANGSGNFALARYGG